MPGSLITFPPKISYSYLLPCKYSSCVLIVNLFRLNNYLGNKIFNLGLDKDYDYDYDSYFLLSSKILNLTLDRKFIYLVQL